MAYIKIPPSKIRSWIEDNFDYKTRKDGEEYIINNPFNGDTGYHFNINPEKGTCHDWRGNEWAGISQRTGQRNKCSFLRFVQKYLNCSFQDAAKAVLGSFVNLKNLERLQTPQEGLKSEEELPVALPDGSERLADASDKVAGILKKWLASRGVFEDDIKLYNLHHRGMEVVWPYYEYGELVYWQSRSRLNKIFRFPPSDIGVSKGDFLYGFDMVEPATHAIITEAIFDAHMLKDQTMASGGAVLTVNQIKKLKLLGPSDGVILAPDNDKAGMQSVIHNYRLLDSNGFKVYYSLPPHEYGCKDWNEIGEKTDFANVKEIMESNINRLNNREMVRLRRRMSQLKNRR